MEAVPCSKVSYKQPSLPKLRVREESNRRDSLSSSRTGDSGYNSDPDIELSPLDFVGPDQLPHVPPGLACDSSILFDVKDAASSRTKRSAEGPPRSILLQIHKDAYKALPSRKAEVTSNPTASASIASSGKPDWTNAFKKPVPELETPRSNEASSSRNEDVEQWIKHNLGPQDRPKERNSSIVSLSSTGSCDMYSITDPSDEEEGPDVAPSPLPKATLKTIELIMRKIEANLGYAAYVQCAGGQASRGQGNTSNASRAGRGTSQNSGGKRKVRSDESSPPDNPDDDGSNKRRRVSITTTEDSDTGPRFACPFYKHDPNRYRNRRTCPGPGWPTVHRMKEHLYRSHAQPIYCPRCYAMFDSDTDFSMHLRSHPCQMSAPQPIDGIDRETLASLRKRSPALRLEEDKWRDTYQLLFPDVSPADIPSPYYDSDSPTEESRRFRRELLERVRQELFATAEREPGPVEQRLLRQVAGIIQRCENELLASFRPTPGHLQPPAPTSRRSLAATAHGDASNGLLATPTQPALHPPAFSTGSTSAPASPGFHPAQMESTTEDASHQPARGDTPHNAQGLNSQDFPHFPWNDPFQFSSTELIDWYAIFPPGSDVQVPERMETFPPTSTQVWT